MKYKWVVPLLLLTMFSCQPQNHANLIDTENPFAGLWYLHIMEQRDTETNQWQEWRDGMQGYILYDNLDNMSVHLTTKGYQDTDLRFPNFVDSISSDALKHLTKTYTYFAKYSVDEEKRIVEHARISHSNPAEWNAVVHRRYTFSGDTLILQPVEDENATLRLKWVKTTSSNQ